ncbi:MAG: hypothetical protein ACLPV8_22935 [Steroidobacteraceae bacterium]
MNKRLLVSALIAAGCTAAYADNTSPPAAVTTEQAQARQFGMFVGGTATQYDLCVRKGFLAKPDQGAEDAAKEIFEKMRASRIGPDQSAYVQEGWDTMKKEISGNESFFTREKCAWVGKEWAKILATMQPK